MKVVPSPVSSRGFLSDNHEFYSLVFSSSLMHAQLLSMFVLKLCWIVFVLDVTLASYINADVLTKRVNSSSVFRFANIYGDHMVLQMKPFSAVVWGFGQIGGKVIVRLGTEAQTTEVVKG